jgi:hypothetical protein
VCLLHNSANIVEKNKESMKNKKMEFILLYARTQRNHFQNAVSGALV